MTGYPHNNDHAPGTWKGLKTEQGRKASFTCPNCGKIGSLADHDIGKNGEVNPSVVCPYDCGFHEYIRLAGWAKADKEE
jgi:hypothetical protein